MAFLTTKEAAKRLGVSTRRVQAMVLSKRLPSTKIGRDYLIEESDLATVADRKPGRPPKKHPQAGSEPIKSESSLTVTSL